MRVLVVSRNALDDTNSIGNTISNFFKGVDNVEFASIYFRSSKPNNNICKRYYRVTEGEILKKWFSPHRIGKSFLWSASGANVSNVAEKKEKALIRFVHKHDIKLIYKASDFLWYSKKWHNGKIDAFIKDFSPDVVVTFVKSAPQYYLTIKYLREKFGIPLFTWIADDEYTSLQKKHSKKNIRNLKYILDESAVVKGCSEEICDYYNSVFGCSATPLYKGCDLSQPLKNYVNSTIKIVYAGNLLYGRLEIIKKIADALGNLDKDKNSAVFEIYSNTLLTDDEQKYFEDKKNTKYLGRQDYETISKRLSEADIVLHAESFEEEQILKTKYSFSTKIIDCLQSGSVLLAIGPSGLASIDYVKKIPGAFVIDELNGLEEKLEKILSASETFVERADKIRKFASLHHDITKNSKEMKDMLQKIMKGE